MYAGKRAVSLACQEGLVQKLELYGINLSQVVLLPDESYLIRALGDKVASLIFPGGRTTLFVSGLGKSALKISEAVERGWGFLGSCAGANLASQDMIIDHPRMGLIEYQKEFGGNFLSLLPVRAHTPAYKISAMGTDLTSNARPISVILGATREEVRVIWNEGSVFRGEGVTREASYSDIEGFPMSACSGSYRRGSVALVAVHPELIEGSALDPLLRRLFDVAVRRGGDV